MPDPVRVAFQGAPGAFTHEVIVALWGAAAEVLPRETFQQTVDALVRGEATHAVMPVHNTTIGPIVAANDAIATEPRLKVQRTVTHSVRHMLMAVPGATLDGIERVLSHPAALGQCRIFLEAHPRMVAEAAFDTAGSAAAVAAAGDPTRAAIAPAGAAPLYGLTILAADLQDTPENATSFAVLALEPG